MAGIVLGIGYHHDESEEMRLAWRHHDVGFHFVDSLVEASQMLRQREYICVTICSGRANDVQFDELHAIQPVPIVVLSPKRDISERAESFQRGVVEYILSEQQRQEAKSSGKDAVQYYLELAEKGEHPISVVTLEDLLFCLEYRTVFIRGQRIELTPKEFEILALLITHPKQVFTYEMIVNSVWHEDEDHCTRKALANQMSNLRNKLKTETDLPNYIVSIRGIGYKFEAE